MEYKLWKINDLKEIIRTGPVSDPFLCEKLCIGMAEIYIYVYIYMYSCFPSASYCLWRRPSKIEGEKSPFKSIAKCTALFLKAAALSWKGWRPPATSCLSSWGCGHGTKAAALQYIVNVQTVESGHLWWNALKWKIFSFNDVIYLCENRKNELKNIY